MNEDTFTRDWHFPRAQLASKILFSLSFAGREPVRMVADPSAGKTMFLTKDLIPAAQRQRGLEIYPIYIGLGTDKDRPTDVILDAVKKARHDLVTPKSATMNSLKTPVKKMGLFGVDIELGEAPSMERPASPSAYMELQWRVQELANLTNKKILLVFDDVQHLAHAPDSETLLTCIKSMLGNKRNNTLALFCGDSSEAMKAVFGRRQSPMHGIGRAVPFPDLSDEFVLHMVDLYKQETGIALNPSVMIDVFDRVDRKPKLFMNVIEDMIVDVARDPTLYLRKVLEQNVEGDDWAFMHGSLTPLQTMMVERLARGEELGSEEALEQYARDMGRHRVYPESVTRALISLYQQEVVTTPSARAGEVDFRRPEYKAWILKCSGEFTQQTLEGFSH